MPPAEGRCFASWLIEYAVNSTAIIAKTTASGVMPPAKAVAAPMDRAVATAGAMWVMDWNSSSVSPIALRSRLTLNGRGRHGDPPLPKPPRLPRPSARYYATTGCRRQRDPPGSPVVRLRGAAASSIGRR